MRKTVLILALLLCPILAYADGMTAGSGSTKIVDTDGVSQGLLIEDGSITSRDYLYAIAEGDVASHSTFSKYGVNMAVTNAATDMWEFGDVQQ